jgi:hypothetical protein
MKESSRSKVLVSSFAFLCYSIIHCANERHNAEAARRLIKETVHRLVR